MPKKPQLCVDCKLSCIHTYLPEENWYFFYLVHLQAVNLYCLYSKEDFACEQNDLYIITWYCTFLCDIHTKRE